jgi:hypothetical protein
MLYVRILLQMRAEVMAAGLRPPYLPAGWGGMGLGHAELAAHRPATHRCLDQEPQHPRGDGNLPL